MKVRTSVTVDKELVDWAKENGMNMSFILRKELLRLKETWDWKRS